MDIKLFEVRDHSTHIPAIAIRFAARNDCEFQLLQRAGYSPKGAIGFGEGIVLLTYLVGEKLATCDPEAWGDRTMCAVHRELTNKWDKYATGDLIDVRVLLGETEVPCESDLERK